MHRAVAHLRGHHSRPVRERGDLEVVSVRAHPHEPRVVAQPDVGRLDPGPEPLAVLPGNPESPRSSPPGQAHLPAVQVHERPEDLHVSLAVHSPAVRTHTAHAGVASLENTTLHPAAPLNRPLWPDGNR